MQDCIQQRIMNFDFSVVANEAQFAEFIQEKTYAGSCCADHFGQSFLTDIWTDGRWTVAFLAEFREQKKHTRKSLLTRIK